MKLFLASYGIPKQRLLDFVDLPKSQIKIAYVTNAADPYLKNERKWQLCEVEVLKKLSVQLELVDVRNFDQARLSDFNVLWVSGGNTWYLRYILAKTKFDQAIKDWVRAGKVYGASSAGAIVAGPTLRYVDFLEEPAGTAEKMEDGLGLIDTVILPHWNSKSYGDGLIKMEDSLKADGIKTQRLVDGEVAVFEDEESVGIVK